MSRFVVLRHRLLPGAQVAVDSSALASLRYRRKLHALDVTFRSGRSYRYGAVTAATWRELLAAESKGSYFARRIRNQHPVVAIG